jgi:Tol biopolymer transport system component/DNA-binding winged helix-turn-helix (wHTH) protein
MSSGFKQLYEFGPFLLDADARTLFRGEDVVRLTPKELDTLLVLVRGAGRVIRKGELLKEIWPDTFVAEATLSQNVFTLRKNLGSTEDGKPYIETVPRRGYRFAVRVRERRERVATEVDEGATETPSVVGARIEGRRLDAAHTAVENVRQEIGSTNGERSDAADFHAADSDARTASPSSISAAATPSTTHDAATPNDSATPDADAPSFKAAPSSEVAAHQVAASQVAATKVGTGHPVRAAIVISVVAVLVVAALVYAIFRLVVRPQIETAPRVGSFQSMKVQRLPVTGTVVEAAISPDGKYLAYVASEPGSQNVGIWIRQVAAASNIQRLVAPAEATFYGGLVFSPDSQHLYFGSWGGGTPGTLSRVPVFGGPVEKLVEHINSPATFAPDGKQLAFVRGGDSDQDSTLLVVNADGTNERALVKRHDPVRFGLPAWSPDGRRIACVYGSLENLNSSTPYLGVTTFDAGDGAESKVTTERWVNINQLAWLPDSTALVMSAAEQELSPSQIWQLSFPSGEARRVTNDLNTYIGASMTADASALITVQTDRAPNIWVAPAGDAARARQVTSGAGKFDGYYGVAWTPDGRIVYASIASGSWDIWMMNADGSGARQLTVNAKSNYGPSVSTDGRIIVFVSNRAGGAFNVWRMGIDGSNPKQLTFGKGENFAHITPDGRFVVYATVGYGQPNFIWKIPIEGGEPVRLTDKPSSWPFVSPDGKSFVCTYGEGPNAPMRLALIPIDGGEPLKLFDIPPTFNANTVWLPDNRGIAFLDARTGTTNVWMQPLAGGKTVQLTDFKTDGVTAYDWSRDNRLAATRSAETTGVVLIRDFR